MIDSHVLVIGASSIDVKGRASQPLLAGTSIPGNVRLSIGGVARNIAENLSRLDTKVILLSAVGNDAFADSILEQTARVGVDVSHVIHTDRSHSGAYLSLRDEQGRMAYSMDDMAIMESITPRMIYDSRALFRQAAMVFLDGNVPPRTLASVIKITRAVRLPVAVDPTSVLLAQRFVPYLGDIALMTPNLSEAEAFCCRPIKGRRGAIDAARQLVSLGVGRVIITMGPDGVAYAAGEESGWVPAIQKEIVDLTGSADALTAAVIFGSLNDLPFDESVRLGVAAATLTYQSAETVRPDLSLELLYEQL